MNLFPHTLRNCYVYDNKLVKQVLLNIAEQLTSTLADGLEVSSCSAALQGLGVGQGEPCNLKISLDLSISNGKLMLQYECSVLGRSICMTRTTSLDSLPVVCEGSSLPAKELN